MKKLISTKPLHYFFCRHCESSFYSDEWYRTSKGYADTCPYCGGYVWRAR